MSHHQAPLDNASSSSSTMLQPRSRPTLVVELPRRVKSNYHQIKTSDIPARATTANGPLKDATHVNTLSHHVHRHLPLSTQAPAAASWRQGELTLQEAKSEGLHRLRAIKCQWSEEGDECDAVLASYSLFMKVRDNLLYCAIRSTDAEQHMNLHYQRTANAVSVFSAGQPVLWNEADVLLN